MSQFTQALTELLRLDGRTPPDTWENLALLQATARSPWLRFALGIPEGAPMPVDEQGIARAARDFAAAWDVWAAYRACVIELQPPGSVQVRFTIDPAARGELPSSFPAATFAVITAWNPGSGEPRPNDNLNRRANQRLAAHLAARMVECWPAVNAPDSRRREEAFCVLGIDLDEAWRIGEAFQQRAIYYVDRGRPLLVGRRRGHVVTWQGEIQLVSGRDSYQPA